MSAFPADHVAIYEQKLFVEGGVWDWFHVPSEDLPLVRSITFALIVQVAPDDRGGAPVMTVRTVKPDGSSVTSEIKVSIPPDRMAEHFTMPLAVEVTFDQHGRYVFVFETGDDAGLSVPLRVVDIPG